MDYLKEELDWAVRRGIEEVRLWDAAINNRNRRFGDLLSVINSVAGGRARELNFFFFLKYELVNRSQIDALRDLKVSTTVALAIETFSTRALEMANRKGRLEKLDQVLDALSGRNSPTFVVVQLLLGLPGDNARQFVEPLEMFSGRENLLVVVSPLVVLPGSRMYEQADKYGLEFKKRGMPVLLSSADFPREEMLEAYERIHELREQMNIEIQALNVPLSRISNPERIPANRRDALGDDEVVRVGVTGIENGLVEICDVY